MSYDKKYCPIIELPGVGYSFPMASWFFLYGASFFNMVIDKDKEDIKAFVMGLNDRYLQDFYKIIKRELKSRYLFSDIDNDIKLTIKIPQFHCQEKQHNSSNGLIIESRGVPIVKLGKYRLKAANLKDAIIDFLFEDWSYLFPNADNVRRNYYVYYHTDPTEGGINRSKHGIEFYMYGRPFYVGKGTGDRMKSMYGRCTAHQNKVRDLVSHGVNKDKIFNVLQDGLTEREALELESKIITYLGTAGEYGTSRPYFTKYNGGILLNSDVPKRPDWISDVILHISSKYHNRKKDILNNVL